MKRFAEEHPTGIGVAVAAFLFALNADNDWLHMTEATAALGVGAVGAIISVFTPRFRRN